ncbi:unnamed protein product [Ectocarpus fasciculatus]
MATTALQTIDTHHSGNIHDAQLDYYGKKLATASSDCKINIFEVVGDSQHNQLDSLSGHDGPVWQVGWAHPKFGVLLASCSYDKSVIIHRETPPGTWSPVHKHELHTSSVNSIAWAPHELGLMLACASSDGRVSILQHQPNDEWHTTFIQDSKLGCNSVSWAPFNSLGSREGEKVYMRLVTGSCDNRVRFWRCAVGETEWKEEGSSHDSSPRHSDWVRDVAWAPATGMPCNIVASCSEDRGVVIWTQSQASGPWAAAEMKTFPAPVWRVSWSITGNVLAVSSGDSDVSLWKQNLEGAWECISTVPEEAGPTPSPHY